MEIRIEIDEVYSDGSGAPGLVYIDGVREYAIDCLGEPKLSRFNTTHILKLKDSEKQRILDAYITEIKKVLETDIRYTCPDTYFSQRNTDLAVKAWFETNYAMYKTDEGLLSEVE
jgi:hypothetical protein